MLTRRSFLASLSAAALGALAHLAETAPEAVARVEALPDDLSGTTTTHPMDREDFFCYTPGQHITVGALSGRIVAWNAMCDPHGALRGEIVVHWS